MKIFKKRIQSSANSLIPIFSAFLIGAVLIVGIGENPLSAYGILLGKSLLTGKGLLNTLHYASPLFLTGLAIAITFKANIYNMGVEGQMLIGGFFAGIVGAYAPIQNDIAGKLFSFLIAALCGMVLALLPALLKVCYRVNELVVTLMLNYAVIKILEFLTTGTFRDRSAGYVATPAIQSTFMFRRFGSLRMTMFTMISLCILAAGHFLMGYSKMGYEINAIGKNTEFAEATGMQVGKKILLLMSISGALSGIAGAGWMMSDQFKYTLSFSSDPGLGWDGMLIALLGGHSPAGIAAAAIFYAALKTGADSINMYTSVPKEIVEIIQGIIILLLSIKFITEKTGRFSKIFGLRERRKTDGHAV